MFKIGIDIGGTNTVIGIVNESGIIINKWRVSSKGYESAAHFVNTICIEIKKVVEELGGRNNFCGIGIGAPNGNIHSGSIEYAPNLEWEGVIPLAAMMKEETKMECRLTNDANAAAVGEKTYGVAKDIDDFILITLGTGVGSGIFCNGKLVVGHDGFAGELGHTIVIPNGRLHWATGFKGSLEAYAGARGICLTYEEISSENKDTTSLLSHVKAEENTVKDIFEAALNGDECAIETFKYTGTILGMAFANFVMATSPKAIILFGGIMNSGTLILEPIKESMEAHLLPIFKNKVQLLQSGLPESDAAILGAAALV